MQYLLLMLWMFSVTGANVQLAPKYQLATCSSSTYDRVLLKRVTLLSKYIFTGKVFGANAGPNGTRVYKVNIRRVLKGDLNDISAVVKFGTSNSLQFSDATVFVESSEGIKCRPLRMRTYGIFLTELRKHNSMKLSLVVEPLVMTLRSLEIIEAAVKGGPSEFIHIGPKGYVFPTYENLMKQLSFFNAMKIRSNDIIVASFPRSGTTITQELVWLIANDLDYSTASSKHLCERYVSLRTYVDNALVKAMSSEEHQHGNSKHILRLQRMTWPTHLLAETIGPRFIMSHIPLSMLPADTLDTAKVVYIARNPLDVAVSLYHFYRSLTLYEFGGDFNKFWYFFSRNSTMWTPYFAHVKEVWEKRHHPNMLILFYEEYKKDLSNAIRRICNHLGKSLGEEQISGLCEHMKFENFQKNDAVHIDFLRDYGVFVPNEQSFIRKGKVGGWRDYFDETLIKEARSWIKENLRDTDLKFPDLDDLLSGERN